MSLPKELTTVTPLSKTLALIMFAMLPVIAFFMGIKYQQMESNLQLLLLQESIMREKKYPTPTPDQKNWETYTNTKFRFSFQYPSDYTPMKGGGTLSAKGDESGMTLSLRRKEGPSFPLFYVILAGKDATYEDSYNYDGFFSNVEKYQMVKIGETVSPPNQPFLTRLPDITVDNITATAFEGNSSGNITPTPNTIYDRRLVIKRGGHTFILGGYFTKNADWDLYQKILSTFKFIQ